MQSRNSPTTILQSGRNCWIADAPVESCGVLIDGEEYYRAFYHAARQATRSILIAGWKFASDVRLLRGQEGEAAELDVELLPFLRRLCREKPDLHIYILAWDYSVIYAMEWEWYLDEKFRDPTGRLHFRFDDEHAVGASHHQKFVVIDNHVAFVGGFDFNGDDWDTREHLPIHSERHDAGKKRGPYHDLQASLIGPAAAQLADYFRQRWHQAGNGRLEGTAALAQPVSMHGGFPIAATRVALSRNEPKTANTDGAVLQIGQLYADAIAAAERLIYIENQYFTADLIGKALMERLQDVARPPLNIAVVLPKQSPGWVEATVMEPPRLRLMDSIRAAVAATPHRVGFYYSAAEGPDGEVATLIHSKLLIVDDRFLTVGSANVSNRSQGLDTELNVSWETCAERDALGDSIRDLRVELLAEHGGQREDPAARQALAQQSTLVNYLDRVAGSRIGRLRLLTRDAILTDREWLSTLEEWGVSLDLEHAK